MNESYNVLKEIQSLASLGHWEWNFTADEFDCSDETLRILNIGKNQKPTFNGFLSRIAPEDREKVKSLILNTAKTGIDFKIDHRIITDDEKVIHIESRGRFFKKNEMDPGKILGVIQDITSRKKTEENLSLFLKVFENTSEAIAITDEQSNVLKINKQYEFITGFSAEEIVGKKLNFFKSDKHDAEFFKSLWESISKKGQWKGEIWDKKKNGDIYPKWLSINRVQDSEGRISNYIAIFSDISTMKESEEKISHMYYHNSLTGLPNNNRLHEVLIDSEKSAIRYRHSIVLLYVDLDRFSLVNETMGHRAGDEILIQVKDRLKHCVRETDGVFHSGADEFTILLSHITNPRNIAKKAEEILNALSKPFIADSNEFFLTASIGIAIYPDETKDVKTLLSNSSTAADHAKRQGINKYQFYSEEMNVNISGRIKMENLMRHAVNNQEFEILYQPVVNAKSKKIIGMEALIRWNNEELGKIMPSDFIPLAEETGIIADIGEWTLFMSCTQLMKEKFLLGSMPFILSVNLSTRQFRNPFLYKTIKEVLEYTGFNPANLELEITENLFIENMANAIETLDEIRSMGIRISIDDFGTGYSSLTYLKNFPVDTLKIDKSFIADIGKNRDSEAIIKSILSLGQGLNLTIIGEGVETEHQAMFLTENSCDKLQGYFFGKPMSLNNFMKAAEFE